MQNGGSIYEYDIPSNTITILHYFNFETGDLTIGWGPNNLLKASNGIIYGINRYGVFRFDPTTSIVTQSSNLINDSNPLFYDTSNINRLIEICRKPSYHFFDVGVFDTCVGSNFSYDILNTNATTYQWLKDGTNVLGQTTGVLNLTSVARYVIFVN